MGGFHTEEEELAGNVIPYLPELSSGVMDVTEQQVEHIPQYKHTAVTVINLHESGTAGSLISKAWTGITAKPVHLGRQTRPTALSCVQYSFFCSALSHSW